MESREYRGRSSQHSTIGNDPFWLLVCFVVILFVCLIAFPWILVGFLAERCLARWLPWRLSFICWFILLFVGASMLYLSFQHGLPGMIDHALIDYTSAARRYQTNLAHWPLRSLWSDTWPVWLRTFPAIGIAGMCAEVYGATRTDTAQMLRQHERSRERRIARAQRRARKRTRRPERLPDEVGGLMVMGVPIDGDEEQA